MIKSSSYIFCRYNHYCASGSFQLCVIFRYHALQHSTENYWKWIRVQSLASFRKQSLLFNPIYSGYINRNIKIICNNNWPELRLLDSSRYTKSLSLSLTQCQLLIQWSSQHIEEQVIIDRRIIELFITLKLRT